MALDAELISLRSAGTYRFERDLSTISNDTTTYSNLRLIVGFSKIGPFNTPNLITSQAEFIRLYGNIDRSLERNKSYFHRSALVALTEGPILCLNLLSLDPDEDKVIEKTFSVNTKYKNKPSITIPINTLYNTDKFWYASEEAFLDTIEKYLGNSNNDAENSDVQDWTNGVLHFTNISKKPLSILVKKANAYNSKEFELTLNDWYGKDNVPEYFNGNSYVSDYMVEVYVIGGDFGPELDKNTYSNSNFVDFDGDGKGEVLDIYKEKEDSYKRLSSDIIYKDYFDNSGFIRKDVNTATINKNKDSNLTKFLNISSVNLIAKYVGSLIPNFVDKLGRNLWIQKLVNDDVNTVGILCAENIDNIENVEIDEETGIVNECIDLLGHNLFSNLICSHTSEIDTNSIDILGYKFNIDDYEQQISINCFDLNAKNCECSDENHENGDCCCGISSTKEYYVRNYSGIFDNTDSTSSDMPFGWVLKKSDGTIDPTIRKYSKVSFFESNDDVKLYEIDSDGTQTEFIGSIVSSNNTPIIKEHIYYKEDENNPFYVIDNNGDEKTIKLKDNEICISKDNTSLQKGDYLLSHFTVTKDSSQQISDYKKFSRITRIETTTKVYRKEEGYESPIEYRKIVCRDKIHTTAQSTIDQDTDMNNRIIQVRTIDEICDRLHWVSLPGFKVRKECMPNGTNERQNEILDMIREHPWYESTTSNLFGALIDRDYIQWRYLVDTFGNGIEEECKSVYTQLCQARKSGLAIINCPSQLDFKTSVDPSFKNKAGGVEVEYIAEGGDITKDPRFLFTLPSIENGASWGAYYYPYLRISDLSAVKSVPPAAYVSNLFIRKYNRSNAWSIVAGQKRGVISGNQVIGVEATLIHENRDWLEPAGINSIIWENGVGVEIYANKTAKQSPKSALSSIHVREACIYIQDNIESILRRYVFEYNTAQVRLEIKTLVDSFLETVKNNSGVYDYKTIMDTSNNTQEVIDNNMGVIDIYIEPVRGLEILTQRLTVMKTGGIQTGVFS